MKKLKLFGRLSAILLATIVTFNPASLSNRIPGLFIISEAADKTPTPPSDNYTGFFTANGEKYYSESGVLAVSTAKTIDKQKYLFGKTGKLLTDGIFTVKGSKYQTDKKGVITCSKWLTMSGGTYYYAKSSGKLVKYSFKKGVEVFGKSTEDHIYLYIDDKQATWNDLPKAENVSSQIHYFIYYKIDSNYYNLSYDRNKYVYTTTVGSVYSNPICDIITGKYLGDFYGTAKYNNKGCITGGELFNSKDSYLYTFNGKNKAPTKSAASPLIITEKNVAKNSVGGVDYSLTVFNNSSKTIKYMYYDVYVINRVNDKVRCDITGNSSFVLKDTGPYKPKQVTYGTWSAFMYNYSASDVKISSVTIEYMDGTKKTLTGNQITYLY